MNKYNLKKGDILKSKLNDYEVKILGICDDVYFISLYGDFTHASGSNWTIKDLEEGFILTPYQEKWKPEMGEEYWFIGHFGEDWDTWTNHRLDNKRLNGLGIFKTKELAEEAFNKAKKAINE